MSDVTTPPRMVPVRSVLWLGMAMALGAGAVFIAMQATRTSAQTAGQTSTLTPITPCRLADTRSGDLRVGSNATFGPEDTRTFSLTEAGNCADSGIPSGSSALALNITALNATDQSFLTVWPSGELPLAASLNPAPGQPPVPNAVTTQLDAGEFRIYNDAGSVDVVIDVVGYYVAALGDFVVVETTTSYDLDLGETTGTSAECPEGTSALSGGASTSPSNLGSAALRSSVPRTDLSGWSGGVVGTDPSVSASGTLRIYAVCATGVTVVSS